MSDDLVTLIISLEEPAVLEALQLWATSVGLEEPAPDDPGRRNPIVADPVRHRQDLVDAARVALLLAASDEEGRSAVERAITGAARKQFVLGGAELVALAVVALGAYRLYQTKGRKVETRTRQETTHPDGTKVVAVTETIEYETSTPLAELISGVLGDDPQT